MVNTPGTEVGYFIPINGDMAYFSSTQNSEGFGDLFNYPLSPVERASQESVELPQSTDQVQEEQAPDPEPEKPRVAEKALVVLTLQVLDIRTDRPIEAEVKLTYGGQEAEINTAEIESKDKKWIMSFEEGTRVYVEIRANGYLNYKEEFLAEASTLVLDDEFDSVEGFRMTPNEVGTKIRIDNVLFVRSEATFADPTRAQVNLDKLVELMLANPDMEIRLEGHTDNQGNPKLLRQLSLKRVETVKSYIVKKGVNAKRIKTAGFGGENPIGRNVNESGRSENRRVEFVIIK